MKTVYNFAPKPIFSWTEFMEQEALDQCRNVANLPFIHHHVAVMPDVHTGYGVSIGTVFGTEGVVIPNAVGVDIGCGMLSVKINFEKVDLLPKMKQIINKIRSSVCQVRHPVEQYQQSNRSLYDYPSDLIRGESENLMRQKGTLGGGNHFIEFQTNQNDEVRITVHSGSRNLGNVVAKYHNAIAEECCERWYSPVGKDLAFLPVATEMGQAYLADMEYCVRYATINRHIIMTLVVDIIEKEMDYWVDESCIIDCCHNFARMENHFGKNVMLHRKGATSAREGELGIIPGSQGTKSYIVEGLGNKNSFTSCSHGAGRVLSRKKAQENLDLDEQRKILDDQGILHTMDSVKALDEAPGAYKNIDEVMRNQEDLVRVVETLKPFAAIKN